jgi:hypothetical protein
MQEKYKYNMNSSYSNAKIYNWRAKAILNAKCIVKNYNQTDKINLERQVGYENCCTSMYEAQNNNNNNNNNNNKK